MNPPCPACNGVLLEIRAGLYCYNKDCTHYKQKVIADSEGKAARFLSIQTEYAKAPNVTKKRIFYETMEDVFSDMDKVIIDKAGGDSVVPYLPLPELSKKKQD